MTDAIAAALPNPGFAGLMQDDRSFNTQIINTIQRLYQKYGNKGYKAQSSFTHSFDFGAVPIHALAPPFTMCVSFIFEVIISSIMDYCQESGDDSPLTFLSRTEWFGLNGVTLQNCVWENEHCHGAAQALAMFGMGEKLDFSDLTPGCFISYDHGTGGHSVCFMNYLDVNGNKVDQFGPSVVGFRFIASNGSPTSGGDGISFRDGILDGKTMRPGQYKQSNGIKNIRAGTMWHPNFWSGNGDALVALQEIVGTPALSVPVGQA